MEMINAEYIKNVNKQVTGTFKFFEKSKDQKVSKSSSKSKNIPIVVKPLRRRSTRLKSEIFVESLRDDLFDGEYDISKEMDSSNLEIEISKSYSSNPDSFNKINDRVGSTNEISADVSKNSDMDASRYPKRQRKLSSKSFQILDDRRNISEEYTKECKLTGLVNHNKLKQSENSETHLHRKLRSSSNKLDLQLKGENMEKDCKIAVEPKTRCRTAKVSKNGMAKTKSANSILKYGVVQDKPENKPIRELKSHEKNKKTVQNSEQFLKSTSIDNNLQVSDTNDKSFTRTSKVNTRKRKISPDPNTNCPPRKRGRQPLNNESERKIYRKLSKMTKEQIKKVVTKKIPKDRLDDALDVIDNDNHPIWQDRNLSCNPCISLHWRQRISMVSDHNIKIKYARQFLLQRDWISLAKILCLFNSSAVAYYPLLAKYAALLLAHKDKENFNKFTQFLVGVTDSNVILKKCTGMKKKE